MLLVTAQHSALVNNMGILQFDGKYVARHDQRIFAVTINSTTSKGEESLDYPGFYDENRWSLCPL